MTRVFLAGSGAFGQAVAEAATDAGHEIAAASSPDEGRRGGRDALAAWCDRAGVARVSESLVKPEDVPDGCDLILAAHSHAFVGRLTLARAPIAVGYHPSLLPLHRGRDSVRWQARLGERVVGGTIYHLTDRVDGGPIAAQRHLVVEPGLTASRLWERHLFPLGVEMILDALDAVGRGGVLPTIPQNDALATWEPSFAAQPVYRPELLEIEP